MQSVYVIEPSNNKLKKWSVREHKTDANGKVKLGKMIYFGQVGYRSYPTLYEKNPKEADYIKKIYINRHNKKEDWTDLKRAGTWSRYINWNLPTMADSMEDMEKRFNIEIRLDA